MTKEMSKKIKAMGEKVSVSVYSHYVQALKANFDTMEFENYSTTIASRKPLDRVELAERMQCSAAAIKSVSIAQGKIYLSLDDMMRYGVVVFDDENEEENEEENEG